MAGYTKKEDRINTLTHLVGLILFCILVIPVIISAIRSGDGLKTFSFIVYFLCVGSMFLTSTLYHGEKDPERRKIFRLLDHCAISLCIAGTYTPIILLGLEGAYPRLILAIVWALALLGIGIQLFYHGKERPNYIRNISLGIYLLMGWISLLMIKPIVEQLSWDFIKYILFGGIAYTIGVVFYKNKNIPYNHAIWHIFIIVGTFVMYIGIYRYLA